MKVIELKNKNVKLIAEEGCVIQSKATHVDEETNEIVPDIEGTVIYLGKNDREENYVEVEKGGEK